MSSALDSTADQNTEENSTGYNQPANDAAGTQEVNAENNNADPLHRPNDRQAGAKSPRSSQGKKGNRVNLGQVIPPPAARFPRQESRARFDALVTQPSAAAAYTNGSYTVGDMVRSDGAQEHVEESQDLSIGQTVQWNRVHEHVLLILEEEKVGILRTSNRSFQVMGLTERDSPLKTALKQVRMYALAERNPLLSNAYVLQENSYPFHMLALIAMASGNSTSRKIYMDLHTFWTALRSSLVEDPEPWLIEGMQHGLQVHANGAFDTYLHMLLKCPKKGMTVMKANCITLWFKKVEKLINSSMSHLKFKIIARALGDGDTAVEEEEEDEGGEY
jgi:hypothetical protein